jgi:hypothetical protein
LPELPLPAPLPSDYINYILAGEPFPPSLFGVHLRTVEPISSTRTSMLTTLVIATETEPIPIDFLSTLTMTTEEANRWRGCHVWLSGFCSSDDPLPPGAPTWRIDDPPALAESVNVVLVRQQAQHDNSPLWAEIVWLPNNSTGPQATIRGLEHPHTVEQLKGTERALGVISLLPELLSRRGGRRKGGGSEFPSPALFINAMDEAIEAALANDPKRAPAARTIANKLTLSTDRFYARVTQDTGMGWTEYIARYMEKRINNSSQK